MKRNFFIVLAFFALLFGGVYWYMTRDDGPVILPNVPVRTDDEPMVMEDGPDPETLQETLQEKNDFVNVTSPAAQSIVKSPLKVKGFAKGSWYFEGSFPVKILDAKGNVLGEGIATAEGDWMTEKFVPFSGTVEFSAQEGTKGEIVFQKDNPSGLPENDGALRFPVLFGVSNMKVDVYFGNSLMGSSEDCAKVFPLSRYVFKTQAVARAALEELLKGPTEKEKALGYFTSINETASLLKVNVSDGVAYADISSDIEASLGGSCRVTNIRAQIERTLKQFPGVNEVIISVDGRTEGVLQP